MANSASNPVVNITDVIFLVESFQHNFHGSFFGMLNEKGNKSYVDWFGGKDLREEIKTDNYYGMIPQTSPSSTEPK